MKTMTARFPGPMIEETDYGTNEIGFPYREGETWFRIDVYRSNSDNHPVSERRFALNASDRSQMARPMYAGLGNCHYSAICSCCWLGFSHTLALHNSRTGL